MGRCAGVAEMVTVDKSFDQRRCFDSVALWDVPTKIVIVLVDDDDVSFVLALGEQHIAPLSFSLVESLMRQALYRQYYGCCEPLG